MERLLNQLSEADAIKEKAVENMKLAREKGENVDLATAQYELACILCATIIDAIDLVSTEQGYAHRNYSNYTHPNYK